MSDAPALGERAFFLAEREEALSALRLLDEEVESFLVHARRRRRMLLGRAQRMERQAARGGTHRPIEDAPPWWVRTE